MTKKDDDIINWYNEHGEPDFAFLESLTTDENNIKSLEKLKSIAVDIDVDFDPNSSAQEIAERIRSKVAENEDQGLQATN